MAILGKPGDRYVFPKAQDEARERLGLGKSGNTSDVLKELADRAAKDEDFARALTESQTMTPDRFTMPMPSSHGRSDKAMLASSSTAMPMDFFGSAPRANPVQQVQPIIDEINRLLKGHQFSQARAAINRLPAAVAESARQDIRRQIDAAEEGHNLQTKVNETVANVQQHVDRGDFSSARAALKDLSSTRADIQQIKSELLEKIQQVEATFGKAEEAVPALLERLLALGVQREQIDQIAAENKYNTANPLQFHSLLEQIVAHFETATES
jgi:hypothetical protein